MSQVYPVGSKTPDTNYLYNALLSSNPSAAIAAATEVAVTEALPDSEILVTAYDKYYKTPYSIADYKSLSVTWARNQVGTATIVLKHTDQVVPIVMDCWESVVPIVIQSGYLRWTGRVEYCDYAMKGNEHGYEYEVTVYCTSDWQFFDKILCWPDPWLPIQVQFPSRATYIGPAISCIKWMIIENSFRLQSGMWDFVNLALSLDENIKAWFGSLLESGGNLEQQLLTPIVVVPTDPLFDTSPWTSINGRMDKISTLVKQVLEDNGLILTADLWLPGDPQPEGLVVPLTMATIVVDCKDMSGVTGPTGTFIDGLITDVVDLQSSALGSALSPFLNPTNEYAPEGVDIAPVLGVNFVQPWVMFTDNERSGLTEFQLIPHSPLSYKLIGGGKSPQWVNDMINATLEWLVDSIEILIGITGVPDTLLDGIADDVFLAFQEVENFDRRVSLGPYAHAETFKQTGSSAYTLDEWFALIRGMWDTRGYHGIIVKFDDGFPYRIGKDIFIGALASFAATNLGFRGTGDNYPATPLNPNVATSSMNLYTDYVERITLQDSPTERRKVSVMIGDGKSHEAPVVKIQRTLVKFEEAFQNITLSN